MTDTQSKWEKIVPKRLENVVDALRKLSRTGSKDYEPIPVEHAQDMVSIVQNAVGSWLWLMLHTPGRPSHLWRLRSRHLGRRLRLWPRRRNPLETRQTIL